MAKIGVLLSGCGVMDGSEIHEAVLTLLAIDKLGGEAVCMAPNIAQAEVLNHLTGKPMNEKRNVLVEAARIARGKIKDLSQVNINDLDALILPGGYGAVKNFSDYASSGTSCELEPSVAVFLKKYLQAHKPLGAVCIAPIVTAKAASLVNESPLLTIGNDAAISEDLKQLGARSQDCAVQAIVIDKENKIVSTPAYMLAKRISEAAEGIEKLVKSIFEMLK